MCIKTPKKQSNENINSEKNILQRSLVTRDLPEEFLL
jgi:hypothetical protein